MQRAWLAVLDAGIASGALRSTLDAPFAYRLMRDGIWRTVRWYHPTDEHPITAFAADCAEFYLEGVTAH